MTLPSKKKSLPASKKKAVKKKAARKKLTKKVDKYGLNTKERKFADLYRAGPDDIIGNAKRCYMKTYPRTTERTAEVEASKLLRKPEILAYINIRTDEFTKQCDIDAKWLLDRLAREANADMADLYHENGSLKSIHEWPEIWRKGLVSGLEVHQEYAYEDGKKVPDGLVLKIKASDRTKRLEMIGKHVAVKAFGDTDTAMKLTITLEDKDAKA